jgi:hypothetical protein
MGYTVKKTQWAVTRTVPSGPFRVFSGVFEREFTVSHFYFIKIKNDFDRFMTVLDRSYLLGRLRTVIERLGTLKDAERLERLGTQRGRSRRKIVIFTVI